MVEKKTINRKKLNKKEAKHNHQPNGITRRAGRQPGIPDALRARSEYTSKI
jgi:hypothetical protein